MPSFIASRHLSSTFLTPFSMAAAAAAADTYAENGFSPDVVADFANEYYRTGGTATDFDTMFSTPTRSSLATMYNSSGELVYCPHNLAQQSEDISNATWVKDDCTVSVDTITADNGTFDAQLRQVTLPQWPDAENVSFTVRVTKGNHRYVYISVRAVINRWFSAVFDLDGGDGTATQTQGGGSEGVVVSTSITNVSGDTHDITITGYTNYDNSSNSLHIGLAPAATGNSWGTNAQISGTWAGTETLTVDRLMFHREDVSSTDYIATTTAAVYLPRRSAYTYNGTSWVNSGINIETEARTNLETYSNDFTQNWVETAAAGDPIAQDATDPWGNANTAWTLVDDNATGTAAVTLEQNAITVTTSTAYTFSIYAKASGLDWLFFDFDNFTTPATNTKQYFDLTNGVLGTSSAGIDQATIEDIGGGWFRCSCTITTDGTDTSGDVTFGVAEADLDPIVDRDGTSSILIYGLQWEVGDTPSSYIPTSGATVARDADSILTIPTAQLNFPGTSGAVSMQIDGLVTYADNDIGFSTTATAGEVLSVLWNNDNSNYMKMGIATSSTDVGKYVAKQEATGTADQSSSAGTLYTPGANVAFNQAARFDAGAIQAAEGGTSFAADATVTALPNLASNNLEVGYTFNGFITQFRQWNDDIATAGIESAST